MKPSDRLPTSVGEVLREEFLGPLELTPQALAAKLELSLEELRQILEDERPVSSAVAGRLAQTLGTSPEFWLNLQGLRDAAKRARR